MSVHSVPSSLTLQQHHLDCLTRRLTLHHARICCYCSTVREGRGPRLFAGAMCLLHEPEHASHGVCPDCARLFLRKPLALEAWIALRRGHLMQMRAATVGPNDAA